MHFVAVPGALWHALSRPLVLRSSKRSGRALTAKANGEAHSCARKGNQREECLPREPWGRLSGRKSLGTSSLSGSEQKANMLGCPYVGSFVPRDSPGLRWHLAHSGGHSQLTVRGRRTGAGRVAQERMGGRYRGTVRLCEGVGRGCARRTSSQNRRFYEVA